MSGAIGTDGLRVVDPHVHLWDSTRIEYPWLANPQPAYSGDNRLLPRIYDAAALLADAGDVQIFKSVNVEANPADALAEVRWLQECADAAGGGGHPHGIVGCADLSLPEAPALLERLAACRRVRGIRQILNVHSDPRFDYVGRHFLGESLWRQNLRRLSQLGLSFDLQLYPAQVPDALPVLDENADTCFILNHAGMFVDRDRVSGWRQWRCALRALAARDNTAVKLSGFAMFDHHWSIESFRPYVLEAIDAFGPRRCMFASNFPIDRLHARYTDLWRAYAGIVAGATTSEREDLLGGNALRYYRLE
jgi:predicted TIM-barrel fold metal-dependent hydrolase